MGASDTGGGEGLPDVSPDDTVQTASDTLDPDERDGGVDGVGDAEAHDVTGTPDGALDAGPQSPWLPASDYCEAVVDLFCPYYLRCGRMAVADEATCKKVFLETCNARYEPHYAAFEALGMLRLSASGVAGCGLHLAHVECASQVGDLDGGCGGMWVGQVPLGGSCGPGIESLTCASGGACVLGLDFCGACVVESSDGTCDTEHRCPNGGQCDDGVCRERLGGGEPCGPDDLCALGLGCTDGRCLGPTVVAVGDACDATHRCPYKASCSGGVCFSTGLLGEACTPAVGCASGACKGGVCLPLGAKAAACSVSSECVSGRCEGGACSQPGPVCAPD